MTVIYVVTSGCYSDYGIQSMFSTKEKAQAFIDTHKLGSYDDVNIEEWLLDNADHPHSRGLLYFTLYVDRDGTLVESRVSSEWRQAWRTSCDYTNLHFWKSPGKPLLIVQTWAERLEDAVKVAGEYRTRVLAANRWGDTTFFTESSE